MHLSSAVCTGLVCFQLLYMLWWGCDRLLVLPVLFGSNTWHGSVCFSSACCNRALLYIKGRPSGAAAQFCDLLQLTVVALDGFNNLSELHHTQPSSHLLNTLGSHVLQRLSQAKQHETSTQCNFNATCNNQLQQRHQTRVCPTP